MYTPEALLRNSFMKMGKKKLDVCICMKCTFHAYVDIQFLLCTRIFGLYIHSYSYVSIPIYMYISINLKHSYATAS